MFKIRNIFGRKKDQTDQTAQSQTQTQAQAQVQTQQITQGQVRDRNTMLATQDQGKLNVNLSMNGSGSDTDTDLLASIPVEVSSKGGVLNRSASLSSNTKVSSQRSLSEGLMQQMNINEDGCGTDEEVKSVSGGDEELDFEDDFYESQMEEEEVPDSRFPEQPELQGYLLINVIGEGAFSTVYRAIPDKTSSQAFLSRTYNEVAIKVIKKKEMPSSNVDQNHKSKLASKEQVLKEVKIHKLISSGEGCRNTVQFIDFQESKHYYFIVQELLSGGEIFGEIVKYTYFSEDLSRHVIRQLALAIKHLHSIGVVHRDIKPENLLFEPIEFKPSKQIKLRKSDDPNTKVDEGQFQPGIGGGGIGLVKLADFGLSKQIYETNTKTPCGTVGYTAPEVVKDERYSMKVDMWGIGCVLYTLLCGFPPFYDEKIDILTEKISRGEYTFLRPWWDEISPGAKACVRKLLEVDPNKRYGIEDLLQDEWLNSCDTISSRPKPPLHQKRRSKSHHYLKNKVSILSRDSSLLYSPAANAMRDAFDVSNAVQRIHGDKRVESVPRLFSLAEDEVCDSGANGMNIHGKNIKKKKNEFDNNMFELRLNSSTILKRRIENQVNENPDVRIPIPALVE